MQYFHFLTGPGTKTDFVCEWYKPVLLISHTNQCPSWDEWHSLRNKQNLCIKTEPVTRGVHGGNGPPDMHAYTVPCVYVNNSQTFTIASALAEGQGIFLFRDSNYFWDTVQCAVCNRLLIGNFPLLTIFLIPPWFTPTLIFFFFLGVLPFIGTTI